MWNTAAVGQEGMFNQKWFTKHTAVAGLKVLCLTLPATAAAVGRELSGWNPPDGSASTQPRQTLFVCCVQHTAVAGLKALRLTLPAFIQQQSNRATAAVGQEPS
jgi:hypothetical protein